MPKLFAALEKRDVSVVPSSLWRNGVFGTNTPTGLAITPDTAMTVTAFFAAIRFRAFAVAGLPKIIYQRISAGKRRAAEHPLYPVLHDMPNPDMTAFDLWSTMDSHVMVRGNAYAEIVSDQAGNVRELWPLRPDKMEVFRDSNGELRYVYQLPQKFNNKKIELLPEQVLHLRGLSSDGVMGYAPITMMRDAVGLAKATEQFGGKFFGNGAHPGLVLKHPGKFKDDDAYNRLKDSWEQSHQGLEQAHRISILEEGMDVAKIGLSPEDSQFLETRVHQVYEISRMTDVPPQMIFELSNANYSTLEQMTLDFVVHHLRPWLVAYEQQCYRSLLMKSERDAGYFIENLIDGLLRGDLQTRYDAYSIGRQNGWFSINDIRRLENMNSIGEKGDQYIVPLNMSVLGPDGMPMPLPSADPVKEPNTPARSAFMPLVSDAAERILKRESNEIGNARKKYEGKPEKFTAWVEQFYKRDYPAFILQVTKPFFEAGVLEQNDVRAAFSAYCEERGALALAGEEMDFYVDVIASLLVKEQTDGQE